MKGRRSVQRCEVRRELRLDAGAQRMVDAINLITEIAYQMTASPDESTRESAQRADSIMDLHTGDDLEMFAGSLANTALQ